MARKVKLYRNKDKPMKVCPHCGSSVTDKDSVDIEARIAGNLIEVKTMINSEGFLLDVDNVVANGYPVNAFCGDCCYSLEGYSFSQTQLR